MQTQDAMLQQVGTQMQHVTTVVEDLQTGVQLVETNAKIPASVQSSMTQQDQNLCTQSPQPTSTEYSRGNEDIRQRRSKGNNDKSRNKDRRYSTLDDFFAERERPRRHRNFGSSDSENESDKEGLRSTTSRSDSVEVATKTKKAGRLFRDMQSSTEAASEHPVLVIRRTTR